MPDQRTAIHLQFDNNAVLPVLFGAHEENLNHLGRVLDITVASRGNQVVLDGPADAVAVAEVVLTRLYDRLNRGLEEGVDTPMIDAALRLVSPEDGEDGVARHPADDLFGGDRLAIRTRKRRIVPRSKRQLRYVEAMLDTELVFGIGPAGTGKTYLAVAMAVQMLIEKRIDRIILSRPAVEAGERLGFLPGDLREKVDPYLRPLYDALHDALPGDVVIKCQERGEIEIAPLAFMRGRTLAHAFVILDEAQNCTPMQMKMFLTRLGEGSRMVVTGDLTQIDLPDGQRSGLNEALSILDGVAGVSVVRFDQRDVVRHALVTRIVAAYDAAEAKSK